MRREETPFGHILALEPGDELIRSLIVFARRHDVDSATIHGLGCVDFLELGFYRLDEETYSRTVFDEPLEVCSLVGNLSLLDGEPFPHVHGVFSRADFSTVGGHIFEAICSATLELALYTAPKPLLRGHADHCKLELLQLEATP